MKERKEKLPDTAVSAIPVDGQPETAIEMVNKYGTYNIQPTAESYNKYPEIAQGYPKRDNKKKNS